MNRRVLSSALTLTLPVLMGYLAIGIAFGLMLEAVGYGPIWSLFMSIVIYAGSSQYLCVELLATGASLASVAILTLMVNFRHLVYGLSMLEKFEGMGWRRAYMIFALTDETYALLSSAQPPEGVDREQFYFAVSLLDQIYWIAGSVIGSVAGSLIKFNRDGIEFAMTALFVVIAVNQWNTYKSHLPAIIGAVCTLLFLILVGADKMLLPALALIVILLLALRSRLDDRAETEEVSQS